MYTDFQSKVRTHGYLSCMLQFDNPKLGKPSFNDTVSAYEI